MGTKKKDCLLATFCIYGQYGLLYSIIVISDISSNTRISISVIIRWDF